MLEIFVLATNYSISMINDTSADFKLFSRENSVPLGNPFSDVVGAYPFIDILIYQIDHEKHTLAPRNRWKDLNPKTIRNSTVQWPEGTKLTKFGNFEARISIDNKEFLDIYAPNWQIVGITPWYEYFKNVLRKEIAFEIPDELYSPAKPFSFSSDIGMCRCTKFFE